MAGRPLPGTPPTEAPPDEAEAIRSETGGLAPLAAGQPQEAATAFARAVGHWRQLGLMVWLGRALSLQVTAARHAGERPAANHLLTQAGDVLDQLKVPARSRPTVLTPLGDQRHGTWVPVAYTAPRRLGRAVEGTRLESV